MGAPNSPACRVYSSRASGDEGQVHAAVLRGLVVILEPGEWYARYEQPADTSKRVRLGDVDRIHTRRVAVAGGTREEMWISGHKPECGPMPGHRGCVAEYVAVRAVERALAASGRQ